VWVAVGLGAHLFVIGLLLVRHDWHPSYFVHFGTENPATATAREIYGDDLVVRDGIGHDGQTFWALARDPFLLDPRSLEPLLDGRPVYRSQRIMFPMLAAPARLVGEAALLWGLVLANVLAVVAGSYATARLAQSWGGPPATALAFALNPGLLISTFLGVADGVATAAGMVTLLAVRRRAIGWALVAGTVAVLAKEPMLLLLAGAAAFSPGLARRHRAGLVLGPAAVAGLWALYVRTRFTVSETRVREFDLPFAGYIDVWRDARGPGGLGTGPLVAVLILLAAALIVTRWWARKDDLVAGAALPFAALAIVLGELVLDLPANLLRAMAPMVTLLLLDLVVGPSRRAVAGSADGSQQT
jgi:hypothetical protein